MEGNGHLPSDFRKNIHSKRGKVCTFSSGLPSNQGYESGRGLAWAGVLLASNPSYPQAWDHWTRTSVPAGSEQAERQERVCLSYLHVTG